jgi:hypothetical protein
VRGARIGRIAGVALIVIWAAWAGARDLFSAPNIARGKPVRASSLWPGTGPGADLVDGTRGVGFAIHTQREASAWVMVDLETTRHVKTVKVYNRRDGYFDEGLPLFLELSEDGVSFREVSRKDGHFEPDPPWTVPIGQSTRFIRVRSGRPQGLVALNEIEVF